MMSLDRRRAEALGHLPAVAVLNHCPCMKYVRERRQSAAVQVERTMRWTQRGYFAGGGRVPARVFPFL